MMSIRELEKRSAIHFYVHLRQEYVAHITFDKTLLTFYAASKVLTKNKFFLVNFEGHGLGCSGTDLPYM